MKGGLIILQNRMKLIRKELNLTQEKFGEKLGMKKILLVKSKTALMP